MSEVDYSISLPDPNQAFLSAFQQGNAIRDAQLKNQLIAQQQQQQQEIMSAMQRVRSPEATADDYKNLALLLPHDQAKSVRESYAMMDENKAKSALTSAGQIFSSFKSGKPEIAISIMDDQITAKRNGGDEQGAKLLETWRDVAKINPKAAEDFFGFNMAQIPGGDKVISSALALEGERRAAQLAPLKLRQEGAEAVIKEVEAKFKPEKLAADLGLTKAQITQSKASANASNASAESSRANTKQTNLQTKQMQGGGIPLDKRNEVEGKLRNEYNDQTKIYRDVKNSYGRLISAENSAVGDLSLIYSYMKILDPGSVVREGEFATAQNSAGVPTKVQNMYNQVLKGERLNDSQRSSFKAQAEKLYKSSKQQEETVRNGIGRIAKSYGLNESNVFYEPTETEPTSTASVSVKAPNGQVFNFQDAKSANAFKAQAGIK